MKQFLLICASAATLLVGCSQTKSTTPEAQAPTPTAQQPSQEPHVKTPKPDKGMRDIGNRVDVMMAVQHYNRPEKDLDLDAARKPAEVLQFSGIRPGMTVVELEAGTGYYTEILNEIVGKNGRVYMQNPPAFDSFLTPEIKQLRVGMDGKRLANTQVLRTNFDALGIADNSADMVTWFLGPHELFYTIQGHDSMGDPQGTYAEIFRVLKPGGTFIVVDHSAAKGAPETTGGDTHRIDPDHITRRAKTAGLVLTKQSFVLSNKADDYSVNVFDDKVRRKTDRFLIMFTKP